MCVCVRKSLIVVFTLPTFNQNVRASPSAVLRLQIRSVILFFLSKRFIFFSSSF